MGNAVDRSVEITERGRFGGVVYREPAHDVAFHWEFGGGDTLAIVRLADPAALEAPWVGARKAEILRFVADEVIRQKATGSCTEIDESSGSITIGTSLRPGAAEQSTGSEPLLRRASPPRGFSMDRYRSLRAKFAVAVLCLTIVAALLAWFKNTVLVIASGAGTPVGLSMRTDQQVATLIRTLEPYTPNLHRDPSKDRYRIGVFLVPLDGSSRGRLVPIVGNRPAAEFELAKFLGHDGRTLWFDVAGIGGIDLRSGERVSPSDLRRPIEEARSPNSPLGPTPATLLLSGCFTSPTEWLGLLSPDEVARGFKPGSWLHRIVLADDTKALRQFYRGTVEPSSDGAHPSIVSMAPLGDGRFMNAALVRIDDRSEALRLTDPASLLMVHTSASGLNGTLRFARVGTSANALWNVDTGIDRFHLTQILPGERNSAFIGTRPAIPGKVSEPLLVIVDHRQGTVTTHSLWQ